MNNFEIEPGSISQWSTNNKMIPNPNATNHLSFKVEYRNFTPTFTNDIILLENQLNLMAQAGWQLDKILRWDIGGVLIVYSGIVNNSPFDGMEDE